MRNVYFTIVLIFFVLGVSAKNVDENTAIDIATNFINSRTNDHTESFVFDSFSVLEEEERLFYIVNFEPDAFVLVSAVDVLRPVPAYSLSSTYDEGPEPVQFQSLLKHYKDQAREAIRSKAIAAESIRLEWDLYRNSKGHVDSSLEPLLTSTWDQDGYYDDLCPDGEIGQAVTGCVATAVGQLMYYFRYPTTGQGAYSYTCENYGEVSADFGAAFYNYDQMVNAAFRPNHEMAEIVHHFGVTVDMDYGPDGSGMWNHSAANSMKEYFMFDPATEYLFRDETTINWDSLIYDHLDRNIPMYYAGWHETDTTQGHAFIVDGYQDEYFHFNWGWGGSKDGYFLTSDLYVGSSCFNYHQELIINAIPDTVNYEYFQECSVDSVLTFMDGSISDGSGVFRNYANDMNCSWLIDPQNEMDSVNYIEIEVHRLKLGEGDVLSFYDGENADAPLLISLTGTDVPETIFSTGNKVFVSFESDGAATDEGWMLTYRAKLQDWCSGVTTINELEGTLTDGSGTFYYGNNKTCFWLLQYEDATAGLGIVFTEFDVVEGDKLSIYDYSSGQLLGEYSGSELPESLIVSSGAAYVVFQTNASGRGQGWSFNFSPVINVHHNELSAIRLFPNPARSVLTVDYGSNAVKQILVRSTDGRLVFRKDSGFADGRELLDVDAWSKGVYLIAVYTQDKILTEKLIIH